MKTNIEPARGRILQSAMILAITGLLHAGPTTSLRMWYSPTNDAHSTTSSTSVALGYNNLWSEGYLFPSDAPQPAGTAPLYRWYTPSACGGSRPDYIVTTDPSWAPGTSHPGYSFL